MAFDAGTIDATLTLNRNPFTAGLAAARSQARGFERERFEASIDLDVDTSDIVRARAEIKSLSDETVNLNVRTREYGGIAGAAYGGASSHFQKMAGLVVAGAPLMASALSATVGVVGTLASAFVIAGSGAGALALVAVPTFDKIKTAAAGGNEEIAKLPPGLREAATALKGLQDQYTKLIEKHQALVAVGFGEWFKAASIGLGTLNPLIEASARAFGAAGVQAQKFFGGTEWQEFVSFLSGTMEPTVSLLTRGLFAAVTAVMNLTEAFWKLGGSKILEMIVGGLEQFAAWTDKLGQNETFKLFMDSMVRSLPVVGSLLQSTAEFIIRLWIALEPLGTLIFKVLDLIFQGLNLIPLPWLAGLTAGFSALWVAVAFAGLTGPVGLVVGVIVGIAAAFASAATSGDTLKTSLDGLIAPIRDWVIPLAERLGKIWDETVIPAWDRAVAATKENLIPVFEALWRQFIEKVLPALERLAVTFTEVLLPAILDFWTAIQPVVAFIVKAFGEDIVYALQLMVSTFDGSFKMIAGLLNTFTGLFTGDWQKFGDGLNQIAEGFWTVIAGVFGMNLDELKARFAQWDTALRDGWNNFWSYIAQLFTDFGNRLRNEWNTFWTDLFNVFIDYKNRITTEWNAFWSSVRDVAIQLWSAITGAWNNFWTDLFGRWTDYKTRLGNEWNSFWSGIADFVRDVGNRIVTAVSDFMARVQDGVNAAADRIGQAWRRVANFFRDPINWVINTVVGPPGGLAGAWNTVMGWIGQPALSVTKPPLIPAFARGGQVRGAGSGADDQIPAWLSNGEYVVREAVAKRVMPFLSALNSNQAEAMRAAGADRTPDRMMRFAEGGLANAQRVAQGMVGKPYVWGGAGPNGADCSGLWSIITNAARGMANPYSRIGTTATFPWGGFVNGLSSALAVGNSRSRGHMAGTLAGTNYEARQTGTPILSGGAAKGADNGYFDMHYSLPQVGGAFVGGGGAGGGAPAMVSWWSIAAEKATALFKGLFGGSIPGAGGVIGDAMAKIPRMLVDKTYEALKSKLEKLMTAAGSALNITAQGQHDNPLSGMGTADRGALIPPGVSALVNATGRPEPLTNLDLYERMKPDGINRDDIAAIVEEIVGKLGGNTFNVMLPQRATIRELADTIEFKRRVSAKGRYVH